MRLARATLDALAPEVKRPRYDRGIERPGIVHLGIGAFHRAHQAVYTDDALNAGDRDWLVTGVSLRSADVSAQLEPQAGLFTVTQVNAAGASSRLIGSVARVLTGREDPAAVVAALADPATRMVTLTVTEKGYAQTADGSLDDERADVRADLAGEPPATIYGYLARALAARRARGAGPMTMLSCDNLADNGRRLEALLTAFLERGDPSLTEWTKRNCRFPSSMVDRIVPAPTAEQRATLAERIGVEDAGAVFTEPFRQWVIEDSFAGTRPNWEAGGAQIVADIRPYETAKLRMLNGAHSAMAYLGLERGLTFVHEAIADADLAALVGRLMRQEAATSFAPAPGQDLDAYADALKARFANPALAHRLDQIATDGSQKIPQRWLLTLAAHQHRSGACPAILRALAAWMRHVRGDGIPVHDPMAERLAMLWQTAGKGGIVDALFGEAGLFAAHWVASIENRQRLQDELLHSKMARRG